MSLKQRGLPRPVPLRSAFLPWNARQVLPPENKERRRRAKNYQASSLPVEEMFTLADVLAEDLNMSKTKARLAIQHGQVSVNEVVVRDPDTRLKGTDVVRFFPPSKIHVSP